MNQKNTVVRNCDSRIPTAPGCARGRADSSAGLVLALSALLFLMPSAAGCQEPAHVPLVKESVPAGQAADPTNPEQALTFLSEDSVHGLARFGIQEIPPDKGGGYAVDTRLAVDKLSEAGLSRLATVPNVRALYCEGLLPATWSRLGQLSDLEVLVAWGTNLTDVELQCLHDLPQLRKLVLQGYARKLSPFGDRSMEAVARMHLLRRLVLHGSGITDAGLARVGALSQLESLEIAGTFGDSGVRELQDLESLRVLVLKGDFTDDGLKHLRGLTNLESLVLESDYLTGIGLAHLADLQRLKLIKFRASPTGPKTLKSLREFPALESLTLAHLTTDDALLKTIGEMRNLKSLTLRNASITDEGLVAIEELQGLEELDLQNTGITDHGLQHIQRLCNLRVLVLGNTLSHRLITRNGLRPVARLPHLEELDILRVELRDGTLDALVPANSLRRLNFNDRGERELRADWERLQDLRPEIEKTRESTIVRALHPNLPSFGDIDVLKR